MLFVEWAWTGVHSPHARLIYHSHFQVVVHSNLTRQTDVVRKVSFHGQAIPFEFAHLARIAVRNLDPAGRATSIAATAVKNVDSGVLDDEY